MKKTSRGLFRFRANEPHHDKTNKVACAASEETDQPGHPPKLISLCCPHEESLCLKATHFAVRMKKAWVFSYPLSAQRRLIRVGGCPGWSGSSLGTRHFAGFIMRQLKWFYLHLWICSITMSSTLAKPVFAADVVLAVISVTVLPPELPSVDATVAALGAGASGLSASRRYLSNRSIYQHFTWNRKWEYYCKNAKNLDTQNICGN